MGRRNICVLLQEISFTDMMFEETFGNVAMLKMRVYVQHKGCDHKPMPIWTAGNRQFRKMMKAFSVCTMLRQVTDKRVSGYLITMTDQEVDFLKNITNVSAT